MVDYNNDIQWNYRVKVGNLTLLHAEHGGLWFS
jgi:hypothetical protein